MSHDRTPLSEILADARRRLARLTPGQARAAQHDGALLVDVRTAAQRARGGAVPGAALVSLNVLEWRLDPDEPTCLPEAGDLDQVVVLICEEGYCSSLAAARLQDLGYHRATDIDGGFVAWERSGLPIEPGS